MLRSYLKNIGLIFLLSIALTGIGYLLDNDAPYPKLSTSIIEFSIITVFLFVLLSAIHLLYLRVQLGKAKKEQQKTL